MSAKNLPPVPAPIVASAAPAPAGRRIAPPQNAQPRSVFDATPPAISAARKSAEATRRYLSSALQSLRTAASAVEASAKTISTDAEAAAVFAHEGLTPDVLKQFGDLATPLLKAFTA
ncbi:hypothetical protein CCP3SC15_990003 [Gammaproteobacteria bacterium]